MFLYFCGNLLLLILGILHAVDGNEEKGETSSTEILDEYSDLNDKRLEFMQFCKNANLGILPISDIKMKTVTVQFKLSDDIFKNCFFHFLVFLHLIGNDSEGYSALFPFDFNVNKTATYIFENVSCGLYNITVHPCFNTRECTILINYPEVINMSSVDCSGILPQPLSSHNTHFQGSEEKIVLIITVVAIILILVVGGFSYYHYKSVTLRSERRRLYIDSDIENSRNDVSVKDIQVFILHYYDSATKRKVEMLKDFFEEILKRFTSSFSCLNVDFVLIEDALAKAFFDRSAWVNSMLQNPNEEDTVIKKIIIIDSAEKMGEEECENENEIFLETIKKLSHDWTRSLDDYDNLFVIHFKRSFSSASDLEYIVKRVRYSIPDHLIDLCLNLFHGSDTPQQRENLRHFLVEQPISNMESMDIL